MKKKIIRIVLVFLLLFVVLIVVAPFFLEAKIGSILKSNVNNNVNATLDFSEAKLSLVSSFPDAEVKLAGVTFINKAPFEGDTLFAANQIDLKIGIRELLKGEGESIIINSLAIDGAKLHIKVNEKGVASYDVAKTSENNQDTEETSNGYVLGLQSYSINDTEIIYEDLGNRTKLVISDMQHQGSGDFSLSKSELQTKTNALVSFEMDSTEYLDKNSIHLDALIGIDLEESKYSFLENKAKINELPLVFNGFVKLNDDSQEVDLSFKTPSSDFKNFLALIPSKYTSSLADVKTTGECAVFGEFKGVVDDTHIPKFNVAIKSEGASFKYPDLPKTVKNIFVDILLSNTTGLTKDTFVTINKASFSIDEDKFMLESKITDLLGNTKVDAALSGVLNLANLAQAYPVPEGLELMGLLNADISTSFDMESIELKKYENTKTSGVLKLTGFEYDSPELKNPVKLKSTVMTFNPSTVFLNELEGTTGQTDFSVTGKLDNLLGFMFNDENIEGDFNLNSKIFAVNDFMTNEIEDGSAEGILQDEQLKIPKFLDCNINASAGTVIYDNLNLKEVKGNLKVADQTAILSNMTSSLFNGKVSFDGEASTKNDVPSFKMKLVLDKLGIGESFKYLELFEALAPVAAALKGTLNSNLELSGTLNPDFTPNLSTLTGNVLAELVKAELNVGQAKVLTSLSNSLDFVNLDKLDLKGLKTALSFEDGTVKVKPFTINYEDISIDVSGSHTFDKKLSYQAKMNVPVKYLGSEINSLIAKIDDDQLKGSTLPVTANIGGDYLNPEVKTDLTGGVKNLTLKLVAIQKDKLINKGKDKATELLNDVLTGNREDKDSTATTNKDEGAEAAKDILGGILGGKNETKDSTNISNDSLSQPKKDPIKEVTKGILGGLFGNKKKKDSTKAKNDSIN